MIFAEPKLETADERVLDLILRQRERLKIHTQNNPRRWSGSLRRSTFARAIQGSNTIEGYNATMEEAIAAVEQEPPIDETTETWLAINGYRAAMTYIMQAASDPFFELGKQFLKSLHFMMTSFALDSYPGQWRPGYVSVVNRQTGSVVYEAPDVELVDSLVEELVDYLKQDHRASVVAAAMAHLNLTLIHPFKDGNGRMARALQTFVLSRDGILHPLFSSIEEWLGRNTDDYYRVLTEVAQGRWTPRNDALPWVRFCLKAHHQQANVLIRRTEEYGDLFDIIHGLIERHDLDERASLPLFNCALGMRLTNSRYQKEAAVGQHTAGRDLKALSDLGLIEPHGEKRGRYYIAAKRLSEIRAGVRQSRIVPDPYDLVEQTEGTRRLPGL